MGDKISIGWATRDVTPDRPVSLRGHFNIRIATRVQDPLTVTALAIESNGESVVMASMDVCTVEVEVLQAARAALTRRLPEFDPRRLIVSATHTHTAPFSGSLAGLQKDAEYIDAIKARYPDYMSSAEFGSLLTERLVDAVCEAWEGRAEGYIGWGYSHAVVGENRRVRYFDDHAMMYGSTSADDFSHIEGHVDHSVNLLCTYDANRSLSGVLMNVACPSQASESGQDYVSADYWHDVREELRSRYGTGLFVLPQCSAAGDQSPHRLIGTQAEARMLELKYGSGLGRPLNAALRKDIARRLAGAMDDAEPAIRKDLRDQAIVKYEHRNLDLEHWDLSETEYLTLQDQIAEAQKQLAEIGDSDPLGAQYTALRSRIAWCKRAADRYEHPLPSVPIEMSILRLGDIAIVTAPFEYYLDYGDRIKGRSAALQTFVVQLAGPGTYLPTARAAAGLSYGAVPASCSVSPAGGQAIVEEAVVTIAAMFNDA